MKELIYKHIWIVIITVQLLLIAAYIQIKRQRKIKRSTQAPLAWTKRRIVIRLVWSIFILTFAVFFYFYPAIVTFRVAANLERARPVLSNHYLRWFCRVSENYEHWSVKYLEKQKGKSVDKANVAATEWPMFGSAFYLLTAEEINKQIAGRNDEMARLTRQRLKSGSEQAAKMIVDPSIAEWVRNIWGEDYLNKENVFYRMLMIMGLSSYEKITGKRIYHDLLSKQANSLADELMSTPTHLLDDYPGECWPNDVLWAVAAIRRADSLTNNDHSLLAKKLMAILDNQACSEYGLPIFKLDKKTLLPFELSRGCANSGILIFAPELDKEIAARWYDSYCKHFWQEGYLGAGFREFTPDFQDSYSDVDSGPIIGGYGSIASFFGAGAAGRTGHLDQADTLTKELTALSWPTPIGALIPGVASWLGTGSSSLGEIAMLFSFTRNDPSQRDIINSYKTPLIVWAAFIFYLLFGIYHLFIELLFWIKLIKDLS